MQSWSIIVGGISALIVASIIIMTLGNLNHSNLSPKFAERFDITNIRGAAATEVCPELATSMRRGALERCAKSIDSQSHLPSEYAHINLPSLDDVLANGYPRFKNVVKNQAHQVYTALTSGQPYILTADIPSEYFTNDGLETARHVLVYNFMMQARFCIEGDCSITTDRFKQHALSVPLFAKNTTQRDFIRMVIIARDVDFPAGLVLKDGFYVASNELMRKVRYLVPVANAGTTLIISVGFIAMFLMTLGFALVWTRFFDYAAFCYFCASMALYTFVDSSHLFPGTKLQYFDALLWSFANLFIAALTFSLATTRIKPERILTIGFALHLFASIGVLLFAPDTEKSYMTWINYVPVALGVTLVTIPPLITFIGAMNCRQVFAYVHNESSATSDKLDYKRRFSEQLLYSFLMLAFGASFTWHGLEHFNGTFGASFNPSLVYFGLIFVIFGVLIYHTISSISRTHFTHNDGSEASRLRLRMPEKHYNNWLKQHRQGILLSLDVKNSSLLNLIVGAKSHVIMKQLLRIARESFESIGFYFMFVKRNGDEWLVLLSSQHNDLNRDLSVAVALLQRISRPMDRLLQGYLRECSVHITVMALRDYTLDQFLNDDSYEVESGTHSIDFISNEANYMMKLLAKPKDGCICVAGDIETLQTSGVTRDLRLSGLQAQLSEDHIRQVFKFGHADLVRSLYYANIPRDPLRHRLHQIYSAPETAEMG